MCALNRFLSDQIGVKLPTHFRERRFSDGFLDCSARSPQSKSLQYFCHTGRAPCRGAAGFASLHQAPTVARRASLLRATLVAGPQVFYYDDNEYGRLGRFARPGQVTHSEAEQERMRCG